MKKLFPALAISEVLWSPKEAGDWDDFKNRLQQQFERCDLLNVQYKRHK